MGLYHGLVSCFTANNMKALIDLRGEDVCTVRLSQETLRSNGIYEAWLDSLQLP